MLKSIVVIKIVYIFAYNYLLTKTNTMKTIQKNTILKATAIGDSNCVWTAKVIDFLETQQQEDKLNTNQLHLIIQTLCTFLDDEQLKEVENLFNQFKK